MPVLRVSKPRHERVGTAERLTYAFPRSFRNVPSKQLKQLPHVLEKSTSYNARGTAIAPHPWPFYPQNRRLDLPHCIKQTGRCGNIFSSLAEIDDRLGPVIYLT
jgi:hypothetical protein